MRRWLENVLPRMSRASIARSADRWNARTRDIAGSDADLFGLEPDRRLLSFVGEGALGRWDLMSDREHGGRSNCALIRASDESALFSGETSLEIDADDAPYNAEVNRTATKTGWCSMRTMVEDEEWVLEDFHGIRLLCRPDDRRYVMNLRTHRPLGDQGSHLQDVYQAHIPRGATGEWAEVRLPFSAFMLTWRGYVQPAHGMDVNRLGSLGILVADKSAGPFALELGHVDAFRYEQREMMRDEAVMSALRANEELGYAHV